MERLELATHWVNNYGSDYQVNLLNERNNEFYASLNDLEKVITRYKDIDAWPKTTNFSKESFDHMQDVMEKAGQLEKRVEYKNLAYEK